MSDNHFRPLSDSELDRLSSDELIKHTRDAHEAGQPQHGQRSLGVLVFRHYDDVVRRVRIKVPETDVEDVAMEVMTSAIRSAFDGTAVGQFVNWLNRIVSRRIADYHRKREGDPEQNPLAEESGDDDDVWGEVVSSPDNTGAIEVTSAVDAVMGRLGEPHRRVLELTVFGQLEADEGADRVNQEFSNLDPAMSVDNVHKIVSRFRKDLKGELGDGD